MLPELLTVSEFASVPGVGKGVIYSLVQAGALPVVKFGRLIRIQKTALHRSQQD
jgi:excisionase family DNA binding protein